MAELLALPMEERIRAREAEIRGRDAGMRECHSCGRQARRIVQMETDELGLSWATDCCENCGQSRRYWDDFD